MSTAPISMPSDLIPLSVPTLAGNEWKYLKECLDTNWVSSGGPFVERFERMMAEYVGAKFGIATVNGTAALHIALLVSGIQPDDEVLVPHLTFIAPANAIRYVRAHPIFIDAEPFYGQMDTEKVKRFIETECRWNRKRLINKKTDRPLKGILPVHLWGHPCDLEPLQVLARQYGLRIIEDATESLGAKYKGRRIGGTGEIACFSFNGNKIITTGGGGMIATNDPEMAKRARHLTTQAKADPSEYIHDEIGYNYRMPNVNAALGIAQMEQLEGFIAKKREIAAHYHKLLGEIPGVLVSREASWAFSTFWSVNLCLSGNKVRVNVRDLQSILSQTGIESRLLWKPLFQLQPYQDCERYDSGVAERFYKTTLSLPCSVQMTEEQVETTCKIIREHL